MKKIISIVVIILIIFLMGILVQRYWLSASDKTSGNTAKKSEVLYWVAPMDPTYRRDKPGKSPMGMDLVPVYADEKTDDEGAIKISPVVENNLGVKTAIVKRKNLPRIISTVGYVTVDENNIEHIHTYTDGWIKVLNVKTTGEVVQQGQLLLELYSPSLINAQEEFLLALKNNNPILIRASKKKLLTLGIAETQINQLSKTHHVMQRIKVYATHSGIVSRLNVREGNFIKPDKDLMTIEDLSQIWIIAEVFERQANWVKAGQPAMATLPYMPGKVWQGRVDYVYPELDLKTHTLRVRLTFPNPDLMIKPNMYADVKMLSTVVKDILAIPQPALIRTGHGDRVILAMGSGQYRAQEVKVGIESNNQYAILSGLKEGDRVVTSAQFLIDSESNLKASFARMQPKHSLKESKSTSVSQQFIGMGKVKTINLQKRTLALHHQPIPALNMLAMTMELSIANDVDLSLVKPGDTVHFTMIRQRDDHYLITMLHVMKKKMH